MTTRILQTALLLTCLMAGGAVFSVAHAVNFAGKGEDFGRGGTVELKNTTTYHPLEGGSMEGGCHGGGGNGMDPCKHLLEDAIAGTTPCVVAATQRGGGSAALYGCKAQVPHLSNAVGKPVTVCFADVYAASQNGMPAKIDIATRRGSDPQKKAAGAGGGPVSCDGRTAGLQNQTRDPQRNPEAKAAEPPPGGGSGGGSPSGGQEQPASAQKDPTAQYPKKDDKSASGTSREPPEASKVGMPGKIDKKVSIDGKTPPAPSEITKNFAPGPTFDGSKKEEDKLQSFEVKGGGAGTNANGQGGFGGSGASSPGGGGDNSATGDGAKPAGSGGGDADANSISYAGGGKSWSGGGASGASGGAAPAGGESPFAKPLEAVGGAGLGGLDDGRTPAGELGGEPVPENGVASFGGIEDEAGRSLFARVHDTIERYQQKGDLRATR